MTGTDSGGENNDNLPALPEQAVPVSFGMQQRFVEVYPVFDNELDVLRTASPGTPYTFFGIAAGAAISFLIVILSQGPNDKGHDLFIALFFASVVLTAYFLAQSLKAKRQSDDLIKNIRRRPAANPAPGQSRDR